MAATTSSDPIEFTQEGEPAVFAKKAWEELWDCRAERSKMKSDRAEDNETVKRHEKTGGEVTDVEMLAAAAAVTGEDAEEATQP